MSSCTANPRAYNSGCTNHEELVSLKQRAGIRRYFHAKPYILESETSISRISKHERRCEPMSTTDDPIAAGEASFRAWSDGVTATPEGRAVYAEESA